MAPRVIQTVGVVLAVIALGLFARLAVRHVGDSYFLADQIDQLQKFEAMRRLDPEGLWGPIMSGTRARALGPLGAIVFGLPVALGLGVNSIHALTSALLVLASAIAFLELYRLSPVLAWAWAIVFTSMRMVWWNAAMFWSNTLLLPIGLLFLALAASHLRAPAQAKLGAMAVVLLFALQLHLVTLVAVPVIVIPALLTWGARPWKRLRATSAALLLACAVIAMLPYVGAEAMTGFTNTRAIADHLRAASGSDPRAGREAAIQTLQLAADPSGLAPSFAGAIALGGVITLGCTLVLAWRLRRRRDAVDHHRDRALFALIATGIVAIAGQALFFRLMARPLNGLHYAMLLSPWYALLPAALVAGLVPARGRGERGAALALGAAAVVLLGARGPVLADRHAELTPWNYTAITTTLDRLCAGNAVRTLEGPGLVDELTPGYDSVLQYVMKRRFVQCRYDPASDVLIAADRGGSFPGRLELDGVAFVREAESRPGLARYRRAR